MSSKVSRVVMSTVVHESKFSHEAAVHVHVAVENIENKDAL